MPTEITIQTIDELLSDTTAFEDEVRKDREALERVKRILERKAKVRAIESGEKNGARHTPIPAAISLSAAIREAIQSGPENFSSADVRTYIENHYPALKVSDRLGTLSSVLNRLVETEKLKTFGHADKPGKALTYIRMS